MYLKRFADIILVNRLHNSGAVLMQGAKGCGKTETALQTAKSSVRLDVDPDIPVRMGLDPGLYWLGRIPDLLMNGRNTPRYGIICDAKWIIVKKKDNLSLRDPQIRKKGPVSIRGRDVFPSLKCGLCRFLKKAGPQGR